MQSEDLPLLAVPNVAEGRDATAIEAIGRAFTERSGVRLLDVHSDRDHHRSVYTLAGPPGALWQALERGARETMARVDIRDGRGAHPHVGALDVAPVVHISPARRGAACAEALAAADAIGQLGVPVLLYGELTGPPARTRAQLRAGGLEGLAARMAAGEMRAEFGPGEPHRSAGVTLVAARAPLVAFNLELAPPATVERAREIAARIREGGEQGLAGVRAIGVALQGARAQVSMNIERPFEVPLAAVVEAVRAHAQVRRAELVGLAPRAALEHFPGDVELRGFDPARHIIENALGF
jgi:glutamate formiminotransferase/glutamate formiminotransferase/formiminotetrahydrofolate cyclodeaminase